jgi:hypothetical protein
VEADAGHRRGGVERRPRRDLPEAEWRVQLARRSPARGATSSGEAAAPSSSRIRAQRGGVERRPRRGLPEAAASSVRLRLCEDCARTCFIFVLTGPVSDLCIAPACSVR